MLRLFAAALLAVFLAAPATAQERTDLSGASSLDKLAHAVGFRAATNERADSAAFAHFEYDTFAQGFRDAVSGDSSRIAYVKGYQIAQSLMADPAIAPPPEMFLAGFREGLAFDAMRFSEDDMREIVTAVQDSAFVRGLRARAATDDAARQQLADLRARDLEADSLLAAAAATEGAVQTGSGLVYVTGTVGTGAGAAAEDRVQVRYTGRLADGTEFDASGETPATFSLQGVVPGFSEGITGMREGGRRTLYFPARLGYGLQPRPGSPIPPNAALVFEVELVQVLREPAADPALPVPPGE